MVAFPGLEDELYFVAFEPRDLLSDEQKSAEEMLSSAKTQPEDAFLEMTAEAPEPQIHRFLQKLEELSGNASFVIILPPSVCWC